MRRWLIRWSAVLATVCIVLVSRTSAQQAEPAGTQPAPAAPAQSAPPPFLLQGGESIVFFGDSITQNGGYVSYFEAYLLTRFPAKSFRVVNHGISSETISGTTEPDHDPPRPWALERFTRDVADWKPDVIVACFGMNDGNYHPFEPLRFRKFQDGVRTLLTRTRQETQAKLVLMTPPPFDPYRRRASDPDAVSYGYRFPAIDYDQTLAQYSQWLVSLREQQQIVADVHSPINEHLRQRRQKQVSYHLAPDAVHPNPTGHWLMAQHLLIAIGAPPVVAELKIDAAGLKADGGDVPELKSEADGITFTWHSPLPLPLDPQWDAESIELENVANNLNRYRLTVTGLQAERYRLVASAIADGRASVSFGPFERQQLESGLDLTGLTELPTNRRSRELLEAVQQRRSLAYRLWREQIGKPLGRPRADDADQPDELPRLAERIETLRQPIAMTLRLVAVE